MSGIYLRSGALMIAILALSANVSRAAHDIEVQSGDTFRFDGRRIRIANIDAPPATATLCKAEERLGLLAREKLAELLASGDPQVAPTGQIDRFSRTVALVSIDGKDIGEAMITAKLAAPHGHLPQICGSPYRSAGRTYGPGAAPLDNRFPSIPPEYYSPWHH